MTIEDIRAAYYMKPFKPFVVRLADGRKFVIRERNLITLSPSGESIGVLHGDEKFTRIAMSNIDSLEHPKTKRSRR